MTETTSCIDKIASAIRRCDVRSITCVPGYPVTELAELLITEADAKWCLNEKVTLEIALGSSASGSRSMAIVKHVGMNLLSDPLITASTHRIGAGIVIIAGDDPMAVASQNEQDSRYWGLIAEVPVLDPNPTNLHDAIFEAYRISETASMPVIVRVTDRVLGSGCVEGEVQTLNMPESFDRSIWEYSMHGRHQLFHRDTYPLIEDLSERSHLNQYNGGRGSGDGNVCIISSGYASMIIASIMRQKGIEMPHISLSFVSPLPVTQIADFIGDRRVLVVEETEPVIEGQLGTGTCNVLGRRSGHLPYGGLTEEDILFAIENMDKNEIVLDIVPETLKNRGYSRDICDDCPFRPVYEAVRAVKKSSGMGMMIAGDMGCSIRTAPAGVVDVAYALGGAIGVASGMPAKSIAIIGDFGLVHSGLQALIDAEFNQRDVLVIVLANRVSAMTGGQKVPDPERIIRACCSDVAVIDETAGRQAIEQLLRERLSAKGVSVIVALGACRKDPGVL
ncbi:MAG: thiamine pyrophosphate-dependent enzyme [Euryarchaeota archaeon]|nr:thiamine pyrophosphate-dependent enzyme [Euryarchaeota archaeon]